MRPGVLFFEVYRYLLLLVKISLHFSSILIAACHASQRSLGFVFVMLPLWLSQPFVFSVFVKTLPSSPSSPDSFIFSWSVLLFLFDRISSLSNLHQRFVVYETTAIIIVFQLLFLFRCATATE
jgi:hypothetical protein